MFVAGFSANTGSESHSASSKCEMPRITKGKLYLKTPFTYSKPCLKHSSYFPQLITDLVCVVISLLGMFKTFTSSDRRTAGSIRKIEIQHRMGTSLGKKIMKIECSARDYCCCHYSPNSLSSLSLQQRGEGLFLPRKNLYLSTDSIPRSRTLAAFLYARNNK